jgi:DNA uptake protein ComE-like DNA-binding protein
MNPRHAVTRGSALRAAIHLAAMLSMVAALGAVTARTADAARSKSSKSKSASTAHISSAEKVDVNTATLKDLEVLPGVGTVMAQKIIAGRPYNSVAELRRAGIPPNTIEGLTGRVNASRPSAAKREPAPHTTVASRPERQPEAAGAGSSEAPRARRAAARWTFFGIPIGRPSRPAPAAPKGARAQPAGAPRAAAIERPAAKQPPAEGMVWVNLDSKSYHVEGDRWYGTTKHGRFMWEDQAIRDGCRAYKPAPRK